MKRLVLCCSVAAIALGVSAPASAVLYSVNVYEAALGAPFDATLASIPTLQAGPEASSASFTYNGDLNFSNTEAQNSANTGDLNSSFFGANVGNISGYSGSGPATVSYGAGGANFNTLAGFLATSGSISGYGYGSLYTFTAASGNYGGQTLTLTHDDGLSVYVNGARIGSTTSSPTNAVTESVVLPTGATSYTIAYARENGTPSILQVTSAVPETASWAMMIVGFGAVGSAMRRRTRTSVSFA